MVLVSCYKIQGFFQDLPAQQPALCCYILLALFREITSNFSQEDTKDTIPAGVSFSGRAVHHRIESCNHSRIFSYANSLRI